MGQGAPYHLARPNGARALRAGEKALSGIVHKTVHGAFLRRRANWFEKQDGPTMVIRRPPAGTLATLQQAAHRLEMLGVDGPTSRAFDFDWQRQNAPPVEAVA